MALDGIPQRDNRTYCPGTNGGAVMKRLLYGTIIPILLLLLATALSIAHIISNSVFLYIFMAAVVLSVFGQRMTRDAGPR
jgi:hypothetical protein